MGKFFSRKAISTAVASSLLFSVGGAAVYAAPAPKEDKKETGRTEQNVQTGVITYNDVTVERYAEQVRLSGTVVIDGPQLVVEIPGTNNITVTKIGDKLWKFEAMVNNVSSIIGDAKFEISAHTIFPNGKNAGSVHTSAPTVTQKIHVPYIVSTVAEKTEWTSYNRSSNLFTLSYNEVQKWSDGDPVVTPKTDAVSGMDPEVIIHGTTVTVPTAIQYFTFSENATWRDYDKNSGTYSATFDVIITDSKGVETTRHETRDGLAPGIVNTISHTEEDDFGKITNTVEYKAPEAPVEEVVVVRLENLKFTPVYQNQNKLKMEATYQIFYSDGTNKTIPKKEFDGTLGNPNGNQKDDITKDYTIEGFVYTVTAHYNAVEKTYYATWELKK